MQIFSLVVTSTLKPSSNDVMSLKMADGRKCRRMKSCFQATTSTLKTCSNTMEQPNDALSTSCRDETARLKTSVPLQPVANRMVQLPRSCRFCFSWRQFFMPTWLR